MLIAEWISFAAMAMIMYVVAFLRAGKHLYMNDELFVRAPEHDMENVKNGHKKAWQNILIMVFLPVITVIAATVLVKECMGDEACHILNMVGLNMKANIGSQNYK